VLLHQQAVSDLRKIEATIARSPERARGALHHIQKLAPALWISAEHMDEKLSRISPKCLYDFIGVVQGRSVVQARQRAEVAQ
jgi:hypothetical protein